MHSRGSIRSWILETRSKKRNGGECLNLDSIFRYNIINHCLPLDPFHARIAPPNLWKAQSFWRQVTSMLQNWKKKHTRRCCGILGHNKCHLILYLVFVFHSPGRDCIFRSHNKLDALFVSLLVHSFSISSVNSASTWRSSNTFGSTRRGEVFTRGWRPKVRK